MTVTEVSKLRKGTVVEVIAVAHQFPIIDGVGDRSTTAEQS
ncbi:MAG: hypothetical protein QNL12_11930 [Acidimicrobiia bacterium]|nr:hypothetical protein [Acidimicrobiia bacterium]MDX2468016.1 hypothetical protein [Acidimicrobiia bacterium]